MKKKTFNITPKKLKVIGYAAAIAGTAISFISDWVDKQEMNQEMYNAVEKIVNEKLADKQKKSME